MNAGFLLPKGWNPAVAKKLKPAELRKLVPKLASAAGGTAEELFVLTKWERQRRPDGEQRDRTANNNRGGWRRGNAEEMQARVQAQIDRLPVEKRAAAQAQFDEMRKLRESMRDLPPRGAPGEVGGDHAKSCGAGAVRAPGIAADAGAADGSLQDYVTRKQQMNSR